MTLCGFEIASHVAALGGVALLAVPGFYIAHYALLTARLKGKRQILGKGLDRIAEETQTELEELRDSWTMGKFACLVLGTLSAAASPILSLVSLLAC